ncbi:MAG TPA: hypothetical protein VLX92_32135 [Kofleriaceae bacterium]|nr:hypothetical protein [Kofleriaceae bacterium]
MSDDDLAELARDLPALDIDPTGAERIAHRAHAALGRRGLVQAVIEPVLVSAAATGVVAWTVLEILAVLR